MGLLINQSWLKCILGCSNSFNSLRTDNPVQEDWNGLGINALGFTGCSKEFGLGFWMGICTKNVAVREREREREIGGDYAPKMEDGNHTWATWVIWSRNMNFQINPNHHYIFYGILGALYMCFFHQGLQSLKHPTVRTYSGCFVWKTMFWCTYHAATHFKPQKWIEKNIAQTCSNFCFSYKIQCPIMSTRPVTSPNLIPFVADWPIEKVGFAAIRMIVSRIHWSTDPLIPGNLDQLRYFKDHPTNHRA